MTYSFDININWDFVQGAAVGIVGFIVVVVIVAFCFLRKIDN